METQHYTIFINLTNSRVCIHNRSTYNVSEVLYQFNYRDFITIFDNI